MDPIVETARSAKAASQLLRTLSGECRAVSGLDHRVKEAARLGFTRAVVPARNLEKRKIKADIGLIPIGSIFEILKLLAPKQE